MFNLSREGSINICVVNDFILNVLTYLFYMYQTILAELSYDLIELKD